jgi:ribonuclease HI
MYKSARIYSDGGSRGNPGPAAAAYLILDENGKILKEQSHFLGYRTNNQAEYEALISALQKANVLRIKEVVAHLDSELVCKHLTGEYRVKNPNLLVLWEKTQKLKHCFSQISFINVPRTNQYIQKVDRLVNEQLDRANSNLASSKT